jgi:hypothetical protein
VVRVRDLSRIFALENLAEALLHSLKGLPAAARSMAFRCSRSPSSASGF